MHTLHTKKGSGQVIIGGNGGLLINASVTLRDIYQIDKASVAVSIEWTQRREGMCVVSLQNWDFILSS